MKQGLGMRLESMIGFQGDNDPFVESCDKLLKKIHDKILSGYCEFEVERDEDAKAFQDLIRSRFRMNAYLITTGGLAAVIPFFVTDNNIFMKEYFRNNGWLASEKDFFKDKVSAKGGVDIENAVMSGDYCKGKVTVYMNFNMLFSYHLSRREIIAILLHELGHAFYPLVHADQLDRTNLIFEQAKKDLLKKDANKRQIVRRTLEEVLPGDKSKLAEDLCSENPDVLTKAAIKSIGEVALQHQTNARYSNSDFEMMADNFSVRFGLGRELITALEKITPGGVRFGDVIRSFNQTVNLARQIFKIGNFIRKVGLAPTVLIKLIMGTIWLAMNAVNVVVFFTTLVRTSGEDGRNMTYDDTVHRYNRIRMQLIADIKQKKFTKADAIQMIETVDMIGTLIKNGRNWRTPLDFFFNFFNPADRRAKDSIANQQALEGLINNDLFLASLKLQQLS